jgi:hypothetical protein
LDFLNGQLLVCFGYASQPPEAPRNELQRAHILQGIPGT